MSTNNFIIVGDELSEPITKNTGSIYIWVGGYTGFTGTNSGFSNGIWTSPGGQTSSTGDRFYSPYAWNIPQNWIKADRISSGNVISSSRRATTTPVGGDEVRFGFYSSIVRGGSASAANPYSISCLYGSMSGDGFTNGSLTAWSNSTTTNRFGDINVSIEKSYKETSNPFGFRTGEIGIGTTGTFDLPDYTNNKTLKLRCSSAIVDSEFKKNINIENITDSTKAILTQSTVNNVRGSTWTTLSKKWKYINFGGGFMELNGVSGGSGTEVSVYGDIEGFYSDDTTNAASISINAFSCRHGIDIWGRYGTTSGINVSCAGWFGQNETGNYLSIGEPGGGTATDQNTFNTLTLNTGIYGQGPIVMLGTVKINNLNAYSGKVNVNPFCSQWDRISVIDGFGQKDFTMKMYHPSIPTWKNFDLGISGATSGGIRLDDPTATLYCYLGQTLTTSYEPVIN